VPVSVAYGAGREHSLRISEAKSPFAAREPVPVLSPPEVFAVYVPPRVDRANDLLIGEHWVFLKLGDSEWFTEPEAVLEPPISGIASERDLLPLRALSFGDAIVPFRKTE